MPSDLAYLVGLMGHTLLEVAARAFYARQNARTPMLAAALRAALFVGLAIVLYRALASAGIALSNSLAFTIEAALLISLLARQFPTLRQMARPALRAALGAAAGGAAAFAVLQLLPGAPALAAPAALLVGGLLAIPFIWPEVRELARL